MPHGILFPNAMGRRLEMHAGLVEVAEDDVHRKNHFHFPTKPLTTKRAKGLLGIHALKDCGMRKNIHPVAPFTLDLSNPTIRLLYDLHGAPTVIGDVTIADRIEQDKMARLRELAHRLSSEPYLTTVIVPSEHVMFRTLSWEKAKTPMESAISYLSQDDQLDVNDLCIDALTDGTDYFFAAIEWKTVQEAREFAREHGFTATKVTAHPPRYTFPRPPIFQWKAQPLKLQDIWQYGVRAALPGHRKAH